jgi:hypothetical protein
MAVVPWCCPHLKLTPSSSGTTTYKKHLANRHDDHDYGGEGQRVYAGGDHKEDLRVPVDNTRDGAVEFFRINWSIAELLAG